MKLEEASSSEAIETSQNAELARCQAITVCHRYGSSVCDRRFRVFRSNVDQRFHPRIRDFHARNELEYYRSGNMSLESSWSIDV